MPGENILQTLQRFATLAHRLDALTEEVREIRTAAFSRIERVETQMTDIRERLARLEAFREADRSQMQTDLARFKLEVERAEMRLARLLPAEDETPALPDEDEDLP